MNPQREGPNWLASPIFREDGEKTQRAALVHAALLFSIAFAVVALIAIIVGKNVPARTFVIVFLYLLLLLQSVRWLHAGKLGYCELTLTVGFFVVLTAAIISLGTIRAPATAVYVFWVMLAVTIYRLPGLMIGATVSSMTVLVLILAENMGMLPQPNLSVGMTQWLMLTALYVMTASLAYYTSRITAEALKQSRVENQQRIQAENELRLSEERHRLIAHFAKDVIWTMSPDGQITYISPSIEAVRGLTPEEAMQQSIDQILTPESIALVQNYFIQLHADIQAGRPVQTFRGEMEYLCKDGSTVWCDVMVQPVLSSEGKVIELLGVSRSIAEHKRLLRELANAKAATERANAELHSLATTDSLTGIWNRRHFEQAAGIAIAQALRYQHPVSMLVLDIDHFKEVNDRYGHQVGDQVLIELTKVIGRALRSTDILARWGGEEFVVVAEYCDTSAAMQLAEKIRKKVEAHSFPIVGSVTISLGVAEFHAEETLDAWFGRADQAVFEAKNSGRNTIRCSSLPIG